MRKYWTKAGLKPSSQMPNPTPPWLVWKSLAGSAIPALLTTAIFFLLGYLFDRGPTALQGNTGFTFSPHAMASQDLLLSRVFTGLP